jgi:hypothetical protein
MKPIFGSGSECQGISEHDDHEGIFKCLQELNEEINMKMFI